MDHSGEAICSSNKDLINALVGYGIVKSERVEKAMRAVDRGNYSGDRSQAYHDRPHSIGSSQTISAPHMHAMCLEALQNHVVPGAKVLDVGSGSGYLCACFAHMMEGRGKVIGIDRLPELIRWATQNIRRDHPEYLNEQTGSGSGSGGSGGGSSSSSGGAGIIHLYHADGWEGVPNEAPFDCIHVGAAAASLPQALINQLRLGGRLIIPVGTDDQELLQIDKNEDGSISKTRLLSVRYVPLVKGLKRE